MKRLSRTFNSRKIILAVLTFVLISTMHAAQKYGDKVIQNDFMQATFAPVTRTLNVTSKITNQVFIQHAVLEGVSSECDVTTIEHSIFGKGQKMTIKRMDGAVVSVELYAKMPFIFVVPAVKNNMNSSIDLGSITPMSFTVSLGVSSSELKTLGTGGLLSADQCAGSYMFLSTVHPKTRHGVVTGWITNERGSGVVIPRVQNDKVQINSQIDYGHLLIPAGEVRTLETLVIGYFDDVRKGQELYAEVIARQLNIKMAPRTAVYCSWYAEKNGLAGNEKSTIELAGFVNKNLKPYGLGVIQLDDYWQSGGNYNGPRRGFDKVKKDGPYPNGFESTVKAIKEAGLTAGIWWMPFSRNHQDPEYKNRQDWFAKHQNGKPFETPWGGTSLDLTYPPVQQHVADVAKLLKSWGFNYFKMDGLWTGTVTNQVYVNDGYKVDSMGNNQPLYNPNKTQIEAFRDGLQLLRNSVGDDVFFSGCCVSQNMRSFGASMGKVDAMRIGPDFNHDGQGFRTGIIRASRLYFLNGRVWWNDPDPCIVRESGKGQGDAGCEGTSKLETARVLPSWVSLTSQFFLSSDWLPNLPAERMEILKRTMLNHNAVVRPVDAFDKQIPSIWLATDTAKNANRYVLGLFNWDKQLATIQTSLAWADMDSTSTYYVFDYWGNKFFGEINNKIAYPVTGEKCLILSMRAKQGHPLVLSTSQHVTQGLVDLKNEVWAKNTLSGVSNVVAGDTYELRIAGMNDGRKWKLKKAGLIAAKNAKITVLPVTEEGLLRIQISSNETKAIHWELKFN